MFSLRKNVLKVWCWVVICLQEKNPVWEYQHMSGLWEAYELRPEFAPRCIRATATTQRRWDWLGLKEWGPNYMKSINLLHRNRNLTAHSWGQMDNLFLFSVSVEFLLFSWPSPFNWTHVCNTHVLRNALEIVMDNIVFQHLKEEEGNCWNVQSGKQ